MSVYILSIIMRACFPTDDQDGRTGWSVDVITLYYPIASDESEVAYFLFYPCALGSNPTTFFLLPFFSCSACFIATRLNFILRLPVGAEQQHT